MSPGTDVAELSRRHLSERTALGGLMTDLGVSELRELSPYMDGRSRSWVEAYRDLCEWATLYDLVCNHDFAADAGRPARGGRRRPVRLGISGRPSGAARDPRSGRFRLAD